MNGRKLAPAKMVAMQKAVNKHMREWGHAPRTIGQEFDESGGVRMPLEVPAQPVEWQHEGGIMVGTPPKDGAYQFLHDDFAAMARNDNGLMALVEGLRALASSPEIIAGEESGAFISGLLKTVEGSYRGELMTLFPSVTAGIAANARHAPTNTLKERILADCAKHKSGTQWKNRAARKVAPDAYRWNQEADKPFNWLDVAAAEKQIRRWLVK
jgi:hypothetical protein